MSSRFIIENATVTQVEPCTARTGTQYWRLHFTMNVKSRNGEYPKATSLACFDATKIGGVVVGQMYNITGEVGVNKDGYLQLNFGEAKPLAGSAPQTAGIASPPPPPFPPAQQAQVSPPSQPPAAPAPAQTFDDEIPF